MSCGQSTSFSYVQSKQRVSPSPMYVISLCGFWKLLCNNTKLDICYVPQEHGDYELCVCVYLWPFWCLHHVIERLERLLTGILSVSASPRCMQCLVAGWTLVLALKGMSLCRDFIRPEYWTRVIELRLQCLVLYLLVDYLIHFQAVTTERKYGHGVISCKIYFLHFLSCSAW